MPVWAYKGLDNRGKMVSGARDADSPKALRAALRRDGVIVTDINEAKAGKAAVASRGKGLNREVDLGGLVKRIKRTDVAAFTRQFSTLLHAGIPLAEALGALFEQTDNARFQTVVGELRTRVNEGSSLADALAKYPKVFEDVYVSMVRAGETAGNLDDVLARLADFMEGQAKLRSRVIGALIYPAIMTLVGGVIMAILMIAVVPQIVELFEDMEQQLPWNTELLIWVSHFVGHYWYIHIVVWPALFYALFRWTRSSAGRPKWDALKLRLPIVGGLVRQIAIARFTRALGTMLSAGVPILRAFDICKSLLGNHVLMKVVESAREEIQQGASIALTLKKSKQFPGLVTHMIAVGERAGQLEEMLGNIADAYTLEVDMKLTRLTSILEPLMIVGMGGAVGFIVFSILMPIMQMNPGF